MGEDVENILLKLIQAADYDVKKAETGHHLHRRDRQDRPQEREPVDHPGRVGRGRAAGAAQDPGGHHGLGAARRAGASTRTRSSSRSTPRTSCSSAAGRSPGSRRSSRAASGATGVGFARRRPPARREGPRRAARAGAARGPAQVRPDPRVRRPPAGDRRRVAASTTRRSSEILVEPKNALVKQYQKFFEFEDVELEFTDDALEAIADQALLRGTGARGLRAILEEVLLNIMYELPGRSDVGKCVIDRAVVLDKGEPDAGAPHRGAAPAAAAAGRRPELRRAPRPTSTTTST